jgi:hypothetical protein
VKEYLGITQATQRVPVILDSDTPDPDIIVLDDANMGFRGDRAQWPQAISNPPADNAHRPWIVVKVAKPLVQGELWTELYEKWADRLIVILSVKDLRLSEVQISSELSWERTAQDVAWELVYNPRVNAISRCAHVIVSFNAAGAMWLKRTATKAGVKENDIVPPECTLLFDPLVIEGMWEQDHPGQMIGSNTCLTASIVHELMIHQAEPNITDAVKAGLCALRQLHDEGYEYQNSSLAKGKISFPFAKIARVLESCAGKPFGAAQVQFPTRLLDTELDTSDKKPIIPGIWTILQQQQAGANELESLAAKILSNGAEAALKDVPMGKFGDLLTVDRREIESFRSIRTLVNEYCSQEKVKRPLSIAVFGPPGSGKSFGITQVAKSLRPEEIEDITFNLSQFGSLGELNSAFHQVRDLELKGKIPLVFWDEFDSVFEKDKFGWLRYFLAPMQDGAFQQGQLTHPIGRCIFVFAGGTSHSMEQFGKGLDPADPVRSAELFRAAKGPDFVSRLKGYVNVLGPNPQETVNASGDPYFILRRAILLRSLLGQNAPQLFDKGGGKGRLAIDPGVLRAFLETSFFRHGARSMEALILTSRLAGKSKFERSSLPSEGQLSLHVDTQGFLALLQQIQLQGEVLERMAAAAHEIYCETLQREGYRYGEDCSPIELTSNLLVPFQQLPDDIQQQNRENVADIPTKLARFGYSMVHARNNEPVYEFPGDDLDRMAREEHERWMRAKLAAGWCLGPRSDQERTNPCLVVWEELDETEKAKDRELVRQIPRILARVGYAVLQRKAMA